jgi:hypothetical protein
MRGEEEWLKLILVCSKAIGRLAAYAVPRSGTLDIANRTQRPGSQLKSDRVSCSRLREHENLAENMPTQA